MQKKVIYLSTILVLIFLVIGPNAYAADDPSTALFGNVKTAISWAITVAAILAAIFFVYGAIEYMFFGNGDGRDRMFSAVIGLVLCLASIILITTINPKIINPIKLTALPSQGGIFLENENGDKDSAPFYFEVTKEISEKYTGVFYDCKDLDPNKTARLLITVNATFGDDTKDKFVKQIECNSRMPLPPPSAGGKNKNTVSISFEQPGIYLYTDASCNSDFIGPLDKTQSLPNQFANNVKGVIFAYGDLSETPYQDITMIPWGNPDPNKPNKKGSNISGLFSKGNDKKCKSITDPTFSIWVAKTPKNENRVGTGLNFYSKPSGWNVDQSSGKYELKDETLEYSVVRLISPKDVLFKYARPDPKNEDQKKCKTFKDCPESIQANGDYLIRIDSVKVTEEDEDGNTKEDKDVGTWAQIFIGTVNDLGQKEILNAEHPDIKNVAIHPFTP